MRPSKAHKQKHLAHADGSGEPQPQVKSHRLRRSRKQQGDNQDQGHSSLAGRKIITRKERTSLKRSRSSFDFSSRARNTRSLEMPSGISLPSAAVGLKLTKTGRVSKAKKGVKGAHRCGCGKTYSRAEHLRRHQLNHGNQLPCPVCGRNFHRQDLYDRHISMNHGDSASSISRRDSATSGSLISSLPPQTSRSSGFQAPVAATNMDGEEDDEYLDLPEASHFSSRDHLSGASSPTTESETSYIKDEPYTQPFFTNATYGELNATTTESHPTSFLTTRPSHASSGDVSPFSPFSFSTSWAETTSLYTQPNLAEPLTFVFNSSAVTSPRTFSAHMQIPGWMESSTDVPPFPASALASPSSSCAPAIAPLAIPSHPSNAPYPLTFVGQPDKYGSLDIESPLEEQQLGIDLSLRTKQHYLEAYWSRFHPLFPVLHRASHRSASNPLLTAAMMAIGAQYTNEQFARVDSRILHEKCLELIAKHKQTLSTASRLDYMQAIFLVEIFSHFKAKRAPSQLSDVFLSMYSSLWKFHSNTGHSHIQGLSTVQPQLNDHELGIQWSEWVATTGFARLLTACYVFETIQALVLVRTSQSAPTGGFDLLIPASIALWDAPNAVRWSQIIRLQPPNLVDVAEVLDDLWTNNNHTPRFEPFQCMILTACHAASVLFQKQELQSAPFSSPTATHPIFEFENIGILERVLSPETNITNLHNLVRLASRTPLRALLATSGESWVLSQRLSQQALVAAAEFTTLKTEMRSWTETAEPGFFQGSTGDNVRSAMQHALNILKASIDAEPCALSFGSEMALYYAALVLWAVTFSAVSKIEATGLKFENDDTAKFEPARAQHNASTFCDFAEADLNRTLMQGIISEDRVHDWRFSVAAVLGWSAWVLGGAGTRSSGVGELLEGAVGVLEQLGRRGWHGDWF